MLPANAPRSYADRNTLWNAAEAVEKQWNSQLARRWVLTIPREIPPDQYAALVRDFCNQQFVSKGMCVDFVIHDKGDGNPHAHVMLTMRAMDEHGKWLPKSRKVYDLDENGERIKLPSGRWKSHKEDTVDWNDIFSMFGDIFGGHGGFSGFGGGGFGGGSQKRVYQGGDLRVRVKLTLQEAATGVTKRFKIRKDVTCSACHGTGCEGER